MEFLKQIKKPFLLLFMGLTISAIGQEKNLLEAFKKSYEFEKKGEFKKAANVLKEIYNPESYEINLRLGWLNYQAGLFEESASQYQRALNLLPYSEEAKFGLILPKSAIGKWNEVIEIYKKILEINPQNTVAHYRLGLIYYGSKNYELAAKHFQKTVDLYPFGYDGLLMLAWTNLQLGKYREAKILFQKVLLYNPDDPSAKDGLSRIK